MFFERQKNDEFRLIFVFNNRALRSDLLTIIDKFDDTEFESRTKMDEEEASKIFQQLWESLKVMQNLDIVHSDVKPGIQIIFNFSSLLLEYLGNILLSERKKAYIIDFGESFKLGQQIRECTPYYQSPEVL